MPGRGASAVAPPTLAAGLRGQSRNKSCEVVPIAVDDEECGAFANINCRVVFIRASRFSACAFSFSHLQRTSWRRKRRRRRRRRRKRRRRKPPRRSNRFFKADTESGRRKSAVERTFDEVAGPVRGFGLVAIGIVSPDLCADRCCIKVRFFFLSGVRPGQADGRAGTVAPSQDGRAPGIGRRPGPRWRPLRKTGSGPAQIDPLK